MAKLQEGYRVGRWTLVRDTGERKHGQAIWHCRCDCGNEKDVIAGVLRRGKSKSCGCLRESVKRTHGMYQTPIHRVWSNMIQRCHNPKNTAYHNYGARGIKVCRRWRESFEAFYSDVGDLPFEGAQLDRINNDLDYAPDNVRWVTASENLSNKRNSVYLEYQGETLTIMGWSKKLGIPYSTIRQRYNRGKPIDEVLRK